jgi:hypothetical protein
MSVDKDDSFSLGLEKEIDDSYFDKYSSEEDDEIGSFDDEYNLKKMKEEKQKTSVTTSKI